MPFFIFPKRIQMLDKTYPTFVSFEEAHAILQDIDIEPLGTQRIHFKDSLNRILAQDIVAQNTIPAYPTAAMDGYAINLDDLELLKNDGLSLLAENKAGNEIIPILLPQSAIKTFTGSIMPINSNVLVLVEHIVEKDSKIFLKPEFKDSVYKENQWIRQVGDNYHKGDILLKNGTKITPFEIGLLAELNCSFIQVRQKAKIGIICIGDEIVEVGDVPSNDNFVRNVNMHILDALVKNFNQEPIIYPLLKDNKAEILYYYNLALKECDMVISTGGMGVGDYDFTKEVLAQCGDIVFSGVRIKPGKPVSIAIHNGERTKPMLGLPGFPNSCAITFYLFAITLLDKMTHTTSVPTIIYATLQNDIKRDDSRKEFRVCNLSWVNKQYEVSTISKKSTQSSMVNNLTQNAAFIILEENGGDLPKGSIVRVFVINI